MPDKEHVESPRGPRKVRALTPAKNAPCRHCGSPVPANRADEFCCAGCAYVFQLLHDQGFEHFYELRAGQGLTPVSPQALRERDYQWLADLAAASTEELRLSIQGLSCIGCVWLIEKVFTRHPGARRVQIDSVRGEVALDFDRATFPLVPFAQELQGFGYLLGPPRAEGEGDEKRAGGLERRMGICGAFAMNAMAFSLPAYFGMPQDFMFARWFDLIAAASATLALLVGGSYFAGRAWRSLRAGVLHMDTPIALGIIAAYLGSMGGWIAGVEGLKYFDFVAIFTFLMLAGRWAQEAAVERNRRRLMRDSSVPETITVIADDGAAKTKSVAALRQGERFIVRASQAVPVAARLTSARAAVSLEWINGESESQSREEGQLLPAGALNIARHDIEAAALETWEQSTLRKLLEARRPGEHRDLALERLLRGYLAVVIAVGAGGALWWWAHGAGVAAGLQVMISIFVVSCPCALGVAVPLAEELAASRAERLGVFVRALGLWKKLCGVRQAVFDKTGTLTLENPLLANPEALAALDPSQRVALRTLVTGNLHPVSRSLFDAIGPGDNLAVAEDAIEEIVGLGTRFTDAAGHIWSLGRPGWSAEGAAPPAATSSDTEFACDGRVLAAFSFRDALREDTVGEIAHLARRGVRPVILSGDRRAKVEEIARQLQLPEAQWAAAMLPEEKAAWVREHDPDETLYVGDGANDSLAFDAALCAGSPVTGRSFLEHKADFYFLGHSMRFVSGLLRVARLHRSAVRRVFAFSVTYNLATAAAGLAGHLNPLAAAILMPLSSVATLSIVAITFGSARSTPHAPREG